MSHPMGLGEAPNGCIEVEVNQWVRYLTTTAAENFHRRSNLMVSAQRFIEQCNLSLKRADERRQREHDRRQQYQAAKRKRKARCGAFARSTGEPCKRKALANGRCKNHGGMSTGPKTQEGKARALANLKQYSV